MNNKMRNPFIQIVLAMLILALLLSCEKEAGPDDLSKKIPFEMVQLPVGLLSMGSPDNETGRKTDELLHNVELSLFSMSKYEVTNAQYVDFLNERGIGADGIDTAGIYPEEVLIKESSDDYNWGLHYNGEAWEWERGYMNHPVTGVTWYGAMAYATWKGGRLPTEAEWEYACRAANSGPFHSGGCLASGDANYNWVQAYAECENINIDYPGKPQAVGTYPPNLFGLYDMHGNVYEWCYDWYAAYPEGLVVNPIGPANGSRKVVRGGGWGSTATSCRSAHRRSVNPGLFGDIGFRVVIPTVTE